MDNCKDVSESINLHDSSYCTMTIVKMSHSCALNEKVVHETKVKENSSILKHELKTLEDHKSPPISINMNNIKYLHKKFKRVETRTCNDGSDFRDGINMNDASHFNYSKSISICDERYLNDEILLGSNQSIYEKCMNKNYANSCRSLCNHNESVDYDENKQQSNEIDCKLLSKNTPIDYTILRRNIEPPTSTSSLLDCITPTSDGSHCSTSVSVGLFVCSICQMICSKQSVLAKHIRSHTNERPFPCELCGFAFKTKSHFQNHCRSQSHILRLHSNDRSDERGLHEQDINSEKSETASLLENTSTSRFEKPYKPKFHISSTYENIDEKLFLMKDFSSIQPVADKLNDSSNIVCTTNTSNSASRLRHTQNRDFIQEHISHIISQNEKIMEVVEPVLQKKYHKITGISRSTTGDSASKSLLTSQKVGIDINIQNNFKNNVNIVKQKIPRILKGNTLNSTIGNENETMRKRSYSESFSYLNVHPRNPERSIIKDILLSSRGLNLSMADHNRSTCQLCCKDSVMNRKCCQISKGYPALKYSRSNSVHSRLPERYNPNTLAKLATTKLKRPPITPLPLAKLAISLLRPMSLNNVNEMESKKKSNSEDHKYQLTFPMLKSADTPLPSPGPLLGKTRLVENKPITKYYNDAVISHILPTKSIQANDNMISVSQTCNVSLCEEKSDYIKLFGHSEGSVLSTSSPTEVSHKNSTTIRTRLTSNGTVNPTCVLNEPSCRTKPLLTSVFEFPTNNTITEYNSLNLPSVSNIGLPSSILHGGKIIPHVPGMPGPCSLALKPIKHSKGKNRISLNSHVLKKNLSYIDQHHNETSGVTINSDIPLKCNEISPNINSNDSLCDNDSSLILNLKTEMSKCNLINGNTITNFLRPTSLSLKPGTFTPKRHHGITPTANTLPLISPETPRPSKTCVQLFLNGHAYTYLGLKCSTKTFYCTLNRTQPSHSSQQNLSMYSSWEVCADYKPNPLGIPLKTEMSLYDINQRSQKYSKCNLSTFEIMPSQDIISTPFEICDKKCDHHSRHQRSLNLKSIVKETYEMEPTIDPENDLQPIVGGYENNDHYTYVRGRGRGRYVCSLCGIRCKKPSMLKKHIRSHTDVRPFTCQHCSFSFKTKGNLTKHIKSKSHYKKCVELGLNPIPVHSEEDDLDADQLSSVSDERNSTIPDDTDSDEFSDEMDENESDSDVEDLKISHLPEHEAAHCLLSLSMTPYSKSSSINSYVHQDNGELQGLQKGNAAFKNHYVLGLNYLDKYNRKSTDTKTSDTFEETMPIDLTKPRNMNHVVTDHTLNSSKLNSIPISLNTNSKSEPSKQLYKKLLIDDFVKRKSIDIDKHTSVIPLPVSISDITLNTSLRKVQSSEPVKQHTLSTISIADKNSRMDALADLAACSAKMDIPFNKDCTLINGEIDDALYVKRLKVDAKNIATEYLKMASAQRNKSDRDDSDDSASDQGSFSDKFSADFPGILARTVVVGEDGLKSSATENPSSFSRGSLLQEDVRSVCIFCSKSFQKKHQMMLHMNIHYMERKFRCDPCAVSFRTQGHLQKHERSEAHKSKVLMTSTFGVASSLNPRPFECCDCKIAFRIHGHLAKHLRSKTHVQKLECLQKLPFGTYAEIERVGVNLSDIDTTDCDNSLASLKVLALKLLESDPSKLNQFTEASESMRHIETASNDGDVSSVCSQDEVSSGTECHGIHKRKTDNSRDRKNVGVLQEKRLKSNKCQI